MSNSSSGGGGGGGGNENTIIVDINCGANERRCFPGNLWVLRTQKKHYMHCFVSEQSNTEQVISLSMILMIGEL